MGTLAPVLPVRPGPRGQEEGGGGLTGAGGAVGVVAGVRGRPVAPQAGVALAVRARGVAPGAAELGGAVAGADGGLAREEPAAH